MNKSQRLITQLKPKNYQLRISISKDKKKFTGKVLIEAESFDEDSITLHSNSLDINSVSVNGVSTTFKPNKDLGEITLAKPENVKDVSIEIEYSGIITDSMVGVYPCRFKHEGEDKKLIATQFESHHAREVFPCVDEPAAKATFELTLEGAADEAFISNTEPKSTKDLKEGRQEVSFKKTPIMSTYLLAFVIGEMKYLEAKSKNDVAVRIWATPDNYKNTEFALDVAVKVLDFYEDYFGIPYPLEKCDHLALPDFAAGAMENWGCITYREAGLITDEHTSTSDKEWVASVIAHELAHQWFGNLVTMQWWNDLWLNEGFASWIPNLVLDEMFPEWKVWEQFTSSDLIAAQRLDALENTHPIEVDVNNPEEIRDIFDAISYQKGASVIRMLHSFVGPEDFQKGLNRYLSENAYKNAVTQDLWNALEAVSSKPVSNFMSKWTSQEGYPFVNVERDGKNLKLSQQRFFIDGREHKKQLWPIPLLPETDNFTIFNEAEGNIPETSVELNSDQGSFFVTNYSEEILDELIERIENNELSSVERLGILNDRFELAKAGYCSTDSALKLLTAYHNEDSAIAWDIIAMQLNSIRKVMDSDELVQAQKPFLLNLTNELYNKLGWEPKDSDTHFDTLLRPVILGMASFGGNENATSTAIKMFNDMNSPEDIHADLRVTVYNIAARNGGEPEFKKLLNLYKTVESSQERTNIISALTNFKDESINSHCLELIKSEHVRLQEVMYWIAYMFRNRHAKHLTWQWVKDNWDWVLNKFGTDIMTISRFPKYSANVFSEEDFLEEYLEFFNNVETKGIERSVKQGAETIAWQAKWKKRDSQKILDFFKSQQS